MIPETLAARTILIVDDNRDLLLFLSESLQLLTNYHIVTATDGVQGLETFYATQPDCLVIDVKMPELDGYQLVRALRGDPATASVPIILLTAMAQDRDRFAGLASGADQYLIKPASLPELVAAIGRALEASAAEREQHLQTLVEEIDLER